MKRTVVGVGYNYGSKYARYTPQGKSVAYRVWQNMLIRCYDTTNHIKHPTYKGCTVHPDWHNFQNFADWYYSQKNTGKGFELDKDLIVVGNKVYRPEACSMIPTTINTLLLGCNSNRGSLPIGVTYDKSKRKYQSRLSKHGKICRLGLFSNPSDAFWINKNKKEKHIKYMANMHKDLLPMAVYKNLMEWSVKESG